MIILKNVSKDYIRHHKRVQALKNINLEIPAGTITGVVGESGAGKSSLLRCVNLLERPTQGQVWVAGRELSALPIHQLRAARREIGMISQSFNLLSNRTVYQNIALPLKLLKRPAKQINQQVGQLLDLMGLLNKSDSYPGQLSGGQKQRVAIARALVYKPKVLLCDEATSALDPETTQIILQLLKKIQQQLNLTILLITHEIELVKVICDNIALIKQGELLEQADLLSFLTQPKSEIAQLFARTVLHQTLSKELQSRLYTHKKSNSHTVLRFIFNRKAATEPLTADLMQKFGLKLNILQAHLETIQGVSLGVIVVETSGDTQRIQKGINYLTQREVSVELMGYVD